MKPSTLDTSISSIENIVHTLNDKFDVCKISQKAYEKKEEEEEKDGAEFTYKLCTPQATFLYDQTTKLLIRIFQRTSYEEYNNIEKDCLDEFSASEIKTEGRWKKVKTTKGDIQIHIPEHIEKILSKGQPWDGFNSLLIKNSLAYLSKCKPAGRDECYYLTKATQEELSIILQEMKKIAPTKQ